ncbi:GtrA family protein [Pseudoxanthomonas helianthi]|uniref:GtrA family protein n=1 Tax=Pseudoxanthomonas helianthi TaxID=1453541 RepID=A0A940WXR2_9GAMM|nr:GtrA family protein [Pseudoxanthomonas helianthi]
MKVLAGFTLMRILCTGATYVIYLLLLQRMSYELAYVISYAAGIIMAYVTSSLLVFNRPMNRKSAALFPLTYLVQFVLSWIILKICVEVVGVPQWLAWGVSVVALLPLAFVMSKWALFRE